MTAQSFTVRYCAALRGYVEAPGERQLKTAYELGRSAVTSGMSILDVAVAHTSSLASLARSRDSAEFAEVVESAGDFLVESLAAFEMVQRGLTAARRAAFEERRRARMLRELSSVLADASVAFAAQESIDELVQIIAEITREATGAERARVVLQTPWPATAEAVAGEDESDGNTWSQLFEPSDAYESASTNVAQVERVGETLQAFDGRPVGELTVVAGGGKSFGADDRATMTHIGEMTAAWLERAVRYSN